MALDPGLLEQMSIDALNGSRHSAQRLHVIGDNLTQGLATIQNLTIQTNANVSDDPGVFAALNAADRTPVVKGP